VWAIRFRGPQAEAKHTPQATKNATQPEGTGWQLQTHVTAIHHVYDENGSDHAMAGGCEHLPRLPLATLRRMLAFSLCTG
jgi:hypothetical protein